jgi:hypothetical protein
MSLALSGCPGADRDSHNGMPVNFNGGPEPSSLRLLSHSGSFRPPNVRLLNAGPAEKSSLFFGGLAHVLLCVNNRFFGRVRVGMLEYTGSSLTSQTFCYIERAFTE